ncbi:MAG: T9SS type A sorting domain-containing protein [Candidatus Tenebribacter burtonii]|nr:T9SS type A sorting domain-containing protein [Candidatus Tenebribacter burtonii]
MKLISLLFVLFFVISNLFSQITDDPERSFDVQKNLFITPLDHTTWDVSTGTDEHRDLLGYNIYIDGVLIGFFDVFFIEMFYYLLTPGQTYIFGVEAVYNSGLGICLEFIFIYNLALNSVEDFYATDNGYASWEPPETADDNRELLGYIVYLNVDFITYTTDEYYQYDTSSLIFEQPYVAGVTAVYDEGESTSEIRFFIYQMTNPQINIFPEEINVYLEPEELTYENLTVSNPGSDVLFFEIEVNYLSGDSWILLDTSYMYSLEAGESNNISVPISSAGLENITYTAELIFENNTGPDVIVPITMVVTNTLFVTLEIIPEELNLINYPNPFNPSTTIEFSIQNDSKIELAIFNLKGQKIKTLTRNEYTKEAHSIIWNGDDDKSNSVSSGVYLYKLIINGEIEAVNKCILLK